LLADVRDPPDVPRLVTTAVIDSIDLVMGSRLLANLLQEKGEVISPLRTDPDPSLAVAFEVLVFGVRAPGYDSQPRHVLRRA
jgi:hypothetical protein